VVIDAQTGLPTRNTDANLLSVDTLYDSLGRPTQIDAPGVPTQYIRYLTPDDQSPSNDAVAMIGRYQAGAPNVQEYVDSLGRTLRVRGEGFDGRDIYTDTQYDNLGRMTAQSTPYSGSPVFTTYSGHDALGRPTQKVTPATESGEDVTTTYAYNGLTTQITTIASDGHNLVLSRSSNSLGQLTQTIDAKLGKTQYAYDAAGNPVVIKDAANNSIYANYDDLGRKLWVNDPNQGITHFVYNNFAELEKETDANNDTIRYELDKLGRIVSRLTPDGNASFFWDTSKKGLLTSESVAGVSKVYSYDNLARPTAVITNIDGTPYKVETEYDANYGRPKALRYPNDLTIALEYNSLGYLAAEKNAASGYVYRRVTGMDDFGNITNSKLTNNSLTGSYLYSPITGQMFNSRVLKGGATQHYLDYSDYDSYGNIKTQSNLTPGINTTDDFVYDEMQRMTRSSISGSAIAATINYRYDAVGNFKYKSDYSTTSTSAYQYQSGTNRVTSVALKAGGSATFGYDNKGNQTHRNNVNEVSYNVFNKPKSINRLGSQVNLFYDASWSRYKQTRVVNGQTITTHYIDKLYEVEFTGAVTSANAKTSSYISDVAILNIDSNGESIRFTHKDRLGSSTTFTDSNGNVTAYRSYDPFGKPKMGNGSLMKVME
jgi:YD repeat-containing protein